MCVEEPGPERRSRGEAGLGRPEKHLAAYASPLRSAFLAQRLTPGRGGYPGRRGAHLFFQSGTYGYALADGRRRDIPDVIMGQDLVDDGFFDGLFHRARCSLA